QRNSVLRSQPIPPNTLVWQMVSRSVSKPDQRTAPVTTPTSRSSLLTRQVIPLIQTSSGRTLTRKNHEPTRRTTRLPLSTSRTRTRAFTPPRSTLKCDRPHAYGGDAPGTAQVGNVCLHDGPPAAHCFGHHL